MSEFFAEQLLPTAELLSSLSSSTFLNSMVKCSHRRVLHVTRRCRQRNNDIFNSNRQVSSKYLHTKTRRFSIHITHPNNVHVCFLNLTRPARPNLLWQLHTIKSDRHVEGEGMASYPRYATKSSYPFATHPEAYYTGGLDWDSTRIVFTKRTLLEFLRQARSAWYLDAFSFHLSA